MCVHVCERERQRQREGGKEIKRKDGKGIYIYNEAEDQIVKTTPILYQKLRGS